jgi:hypothetical protein
VTAEQRPCPVCGTEFTWTPAAPRQKFCSIRCKHRWHTAHRGPRRRRPATDVAPQAADAARPAPPPPGSGSLTAAPACPHRRQPVALVAWLVPPAASITTPLQHAATHRNGP